MGLNLNSKDSHSFKISKVPCPHCAHLCAPKLDFCPICEEPLLKSPPDTNSNEITFKLKGNTEEHKYLKLLESEIGKSIPLREIIDNKSLG